MKTDNQAIEAIFSAVCKAYDLSKTQILGKSNGTTAAELTEARVLCMYFLREIGLTFQQVASVMQRTAASSAQKAYAQAKMWVEKDLYKDFTQKFKHLSDTLKMPELPENTPTDAPTNEETQVFENFDADTTSNENVELTSEPAPTFAPTQEAQTLIQAEEDILNIIEDDTPDPLSVTDAPLAQTPITRDLGSHYKPSAEAEAISKGADYDNPFADFDNVVTKTSNVKNALNATIIDDSVAAAEFEKLPTNTGGGIGGNTSKIIIDNETADFTVETFVTLLEVASTEVCHHYSQIDEEKVRKLEKEGEVPKQSTKTAIEINKNAHKKLEDTAKTKAELIKDALKKVVINKNMSVSPEMALFFMFIIFAGFMFMTTKQIRQDGIDAIERMRDVKIDNDKNKIAP